MSKALNWDGEIENDGGESILLPEGEYHFQVLGYDRKWSQNKQCPMARVKMRVVTDDGTAVVYDTLLLHSDFEWKLCAFFRSTGLRKHGERVVMRWQQVPGQWGRFAIHHEEYTGRDNEKRVGHKVKHFLDRDDAPPPAWCLEPVPAQAAAEPAAGTEPEEECPF